MQAEPISKVEPQATLSQPVVSRPLLPSGLKSSEFWLVLLVIVALAAETFSGVLPAELAAKAMVVSAGLYKLLRFFLKMRAAGLQAETVIAQIDAETERKVTIGPDQSGQARRTTASGSVNYALLVGLALIGVVLFTIVALGGRASTNLSTAGWSSPAARQAHNLEVVGSNPSPATFPAATLPDGNQPFYGPSGNSPSVTFRIDPLPLPSDDEDEEEEVEEESAPAFRILPPELRSGVPESWQRRLYHPGPDGTPVIIIPIFEAEGPLVVHHTTR